MKATPRVGILATLSLLAAGSAASADADGIRKSLKAGEIESMRLNLAPAGAGLGFEMALSGDDPRVEALAELVREAEPGGGHKCPHQGAIRFRMRDGRVVGVGLLPSHTPGIYELRLYDGERYLEAYRVERAALLRALEDLGVPVADPAFRE